MGRLMKNRLWNALTIWGRMKQKYPNKNGCRDCHVDGKKKKEHSHSVAALMAVAR